MSKKDNKYAKKGKKWTDDEVYEYLSQYLHGFTAQEIAAGDGSTLVEKEGKYNRQQHSVEKKLQNTMKEILQQNLVLSPIRYGELFVCSLINHLSSLAIVSIVPEAYKKMVLLAIDHLEEIYLGTIKKCTVDLVKDPTTVIMDAEDNPYTFLVMCMADVFRMPGAHKILSDIIKSDPEEEIHGRLFDFLEEKLPEVREKHIDKLKNSHWI